MTQKVRVRNSRRNFWSAWPCSTSRTGKRLANSADQSKCTSTPILGVMIRLSRQRSEPAEEGTVSGGCKGACVRRRTTQQRKNQGKGKGKGKTWNNCGEHGRCAPDCVALEGTGKASTVSRHTGVVTVQLWLRPMALRGPKPSRKAGPTPRRGLTRDSTLACSWSVREGPIGGFVKNSFDGQRAWRRVSMAIDTGENL